jgi:EmrB/QacA subfamily drug resistance transporter
MRAPRLVPFIIGAALFMQTLDATVIANALPTMAKSLGVDALTLSLAITSYIISTAVFLPISGWMADRYGARSVFAWAIALFAASSLLCGAADSLPSLILGRVAQGAAGAMMTPVGRLVLLRTVPKQFYVQAMAYLTMPALVGPVVGPVLGGFIVTYSSWRWIFFINLPVGLAGVLLTLLYVPNIREPATAPLDRRGFVLTGLGLAGLVYGLDNLGKALLPLPVVLGMIGAGIACFVLYAAHARGNRDAILDLGLLRQRTFLAATVGGLFSRLAIGASPFLLALLFQLGFGFSAFQAGLLTFVSAVGALAMKTTAPPIIAYFGYRRILIANTFITGVIFIFYAWFRPDMPQIVIMGTLLVGGFFRSLQFTSLNTLAFADIPDDRMSRASSLSSIFQQLSRSFGVAIAAILVALIQARNGSGVLSVADIAPAFAVIGGLSMLSLFFFLPLPADAGDSIRGRHGRSRPIATGLAETEADGALPGKSS